MRITKHRHHPTWKPGFFVIASGPELLDMINEFGTVKAVEVSEISIVETDKLIMNAMEGSKCNQQ